MTDANHNPRAFPSSAIADDFGGMSLRDYFAGQALNQAVRDVWEHHKPEDVAKRCYLFAEAMLAERKIVEASK